MLTGSVEKGIYEFSSLQNHIQGVSQRYSPPLELNPKGLGKKQKYCYKLY